MTSLVIEAIAAMSETMISNKQFLTDLDSAIGDGDHGVNMARGFESVKLRLRGLSDEKDIATILKIVGRTLIATVGGDSGSMYGTGCIRAAHVGKDKFELDKEAGIAMLSAIIQGIKEQGNATTGEKTMLDALEPACEAFIEGVNSQKTFVECLAMARDAAKNGVEFTKTIIATKGQAAQVGTQSLGHQDPGATSAYIMLATLTEFCQKQEVQQAG